MVAFNELVAMAIWLCLAVFLGILDIKIKMLKGICTINLKVPEDSESHHSAYSLPIFRKCQMTHVSV